MNKRLLMILTLAGSLLAAPVFAASSDVETIEGVISAVSAANGTITVRNNATGERRIYFVEDASAITVGGRAGSLGDLERGQRVTMRYRSGDEGREVVALGVPVPGANEELARVTTTEEGTMEGVVTGTRPGKKTITVRDDATRERRTLRYSDDTRFMRDGRSISPNRIARGDGVKVRYRRTAEGWVIVTARAPVEEIAAAPADPAPMVAQLPKTASLLPALGLFGIGLVAMGGLLRYRRKRH